MPEEIENRMDMVRGVKDNFPGLDPYRKTLKGNKMRAAGA